MRTAEFEVSTVKGKQVVDVTSEIERALLKLEPKEGPCLIFVKHSTAALAIGEYGEGTGEDLLEVAQRIVPQIDFRHGHDPSHAPDHMASSILGPGVQVPVARGKLLLGTWQRVLLLEFNGPRKRAVVVQL